MCDCVKECGRQRLFQPAVELGINDVKSDAQQTQNAKSEKTGEWKESGDRAHISCETK